MKEITIFLLNNINYIHIIYFTKEYYNQMQIF